MLNKAEQRPNPCPDWIDAQTWDNITELDEIESMKGIASSFEQFSVEWYKYFMQETPETSSMPGDWDAKCSDLQKLLIVRSLRSDRVTYAATTFVSENIGDRFVQPPEFDLMKVFKTSNSVQPLVFVLSPGVDPVVNVMALAKSVGTTLDSCALGQGQAVSCTPHCVLVA